jgi:glutathione S-transferase
MKVETYLRMAGLAYETVNDASPLKAPKKKLPYIDDNGKIFADSGFILEYLKQTYGDTLDAERTRADSAAAHALRRLFEESLYWVTLYSRWMEEPTWSAVRKQFFDSMPPVIKQIIPAMIRRSVRKALYLQGMGRHSREEIYQIGQADLTAVSSSLGAKAYFMGDAPTSLDAIAYAFLANILVPPFDSPLKDHALALGNLKPYCDRMREKYF